MDYFKLYIALWGGACVAASIIFLKDKAAYAFYHADYRRFLFVPWKLITFLIATTGLTVIAPYTGDPTWDYYDSIFMSILTFLSAPWAVGALYKAARKRLPAKQAYVAFCIWMFSCSWSYDLYLLFRDGHYPITWISNLVLSSVLYISAGLLWNLDYKEGKGVIFSFMEDGWPGGSGSPAFKKIALYALLFIIIATVIVVAFVWQDIRDLLIGLEV